MLNVEDFRLYCLSKTGTSEKMPFGGDVLVFKVMEKMFALTSLESEEFRVNLKCDPDWSVELREEHPEIIPGYHMNKKHWNTVSFEGDLSQKMLQELVDHSYDLVVAKLTKKQKAALSELKKATQ